MYVASCKSCDCVVYCSLLHVVKMASKFHMSMSELLSRYKLDKSLPFLKSKCSNEHIIMMADRLQDWEKITPSLGVSADDVKANVGKPDSSLHRRKCLQIWKEYAGFKATYYALLEVLMESHLVDAACNICERLAEFLQGMVVFILNTPFTMLFQSQSNKIELLFLSLPPSHLLGQE